MDIKELPELQEDVSVDEELKEPPKYKVLMHNDDYTTMEFVVRVLMTVFHKPKAEAVRIMLNIHHTGIGVCGVYPYEIAETKVALVHNMARKEGFPLKCTIEEV